MTKNIYVIGWIHKLGYFIALAYFIDLNKAKDVAKIRKCRVYKLEEVIV